jgi:hypothetical protein
MLPIKSGDHVHAAPPELRLTTYQTALGCINAARESFRAAAIVDGRCDGRLYEQISNRAETEAQSELERVSTVWSELRRYRSYAEA